jgi:parallel beta-helix repeat protein
MVLCVFTLGSLAACGDSSSGGDDGLALGKVKAFYGANGANWNDYVKDDGAGMFSASGTACDPSVDTSCIHGGQMRYVEVTGRSDCTGLVALDMLDVFKWECDAATDPVRMVSTGLRDGRYLSDLIDFFKEDWSKNIIAVYADGSLYMMTLPAIWWDNAIVVNNDGSDGTDMAAGEIHIVTTNAAATYTIGADSVAMVVRPGVTLTGSATINENIVSASGRSFIWLEGKVDATGDQYGYYLSNTGFSVLDNVEADNGSRGVYLDSSSNNTLSNITASGNSNGVYLLSSTDNMLSNITASGNSNGVCLLSSTDNMLSNITASNNNSFGVYLSSSWNNTLSDITASGSYYGVYLSSSSNNTLSNITATSNTEGVRLSSSSNNTLNNIAASGNEYEVSISSSSNNYLTGFLKVGGYCEVFGGTDPGLVHVTCANQGASDAVYSTDISTLNVLSVPTGDDTLTHLWSAADATTCGAIAGAAWGGNVCSLPGYDNQTACEAASGNWTSDKCSTVFLRNAVEMQGDGVENENTLCETGETCLFTPNIGAHQGSGGLIPAGTFTNGTLTGITLMEYENNP